MTTKNRGPFMNLNTYREKWLISIKKVMSLKILNLSYRALWELQVHLSSKCLTQGPWILIKVQSSPPKPPRTIKPKSLEYFQTSIQLKAPLKTSVSKTRTTLITPFLPESVMILQASEIKLLL